MTQKVNAIVKEQNCSSEKPKSKPQKKRNEKFEAAED